MTQVVYNAIIVKFACNHSATLDLYEFWKMRVTKIKPGSNNDRKSNNERKIKENYSPFHKSLALMQKNKKQKKKKPAWKA